MTPQSFETIALAWIASVVTVVLALGAAYVKLKPVIDSLSAAIVSLLAKHEANATAIDANAKRIDAHDNLQGVKTTVDSAGTTTIEAKV